MLQSLIRPFWVSGIHSASASFVHGQVACEYNTTHINLTPDCLSLYSRFGGTFSP